MTSSRWALWIGTVVAGACIAVGAGHGVAAADTDSSGSGGSTSRSAGPDSSQSADSSPQSDDVDRTADTAKRSDTRAPEESDARPSRFRSNRVITLEHEDADAAATTTTRRSAEPTPDKAEPADPSEPSDTTADDTDGPAAPAVESTTPVSTEPVSSPVTEVVDAAPAPATELDDAAQTPEVIESEIAAAPLVASSASADKPRSPGPVTTAVWNVLTALGWSARPETVPDTTTPNPATSTQAASAQASPGAVTGVQTGRATLTIPVGPDGYTTRADWYLPTQADGSVSATGVIWLQHGFLGNKSFVSALAKTISQQTNSIVVAPNLSSFPLRCSACWINAVPMQQAVATMFLGDRASLNTSAIAAGYQGTLPDHFVLSGQSAGGGLAAAAGGYYVTDPANSDDLRGVVMFDGFAFGGVVSDAVDRLDTRAIPVYQVAAPPQSWNSFGASTAELVAARPGQFVGATLAGGSHSDSLLGANPILDLVLQLVTGFSPPGNTAAVYTLATGWINDTYQGLGPTDGTGTYGVPGQYIVMGDTAAIVLAPAPIVDLDRYLGTWYELGSVKQFFSIGLVNTTAVYSPNADGSIKVENSGNYFVNNGPESSIVGAALPVDAANNKLNVRFFGPASARPPGNYWIVDLDPHYQWAVVSDSTGISGFLLSRTRVVSGDLYQELLDRASVKGVKGRITPTRQPAAQPAP